MQSGSEVKLSHLFPTGKPTTTEEKLLSRLFSYLPAKPELAFQMQMNTWKGALWPPASPLPKSTRRIKWSTVKLQQCVSCNPSPLQSCNTECSFNQPLLALCGCQAPTWPNSKLIHFSIDLFDNNRKSFPSVLQSERSTTWSSNSERLLSFSRSTGDSCNVMLQHPAMAISGIGFEIALHSGPPLLWLRPSTQHHIIHQWDGNSDGGERGLEEREPENERWKKGQQEGVLIKSGRDKTG